LPCDAWFGKSFSLFSPELFPWTAGISADAEIVTTSVPPLGFLCDLCGDSASFAVKSLNRKGLGKVREEREEIDLARTLVP
jgi:hypothetical protein